MARLSNLTGRGLETQRLLGEVLLQLIAEKGYEKTSVKDITGRAGVERTTFYLHFKDKDDLFLKSQQRLINDLFTYAKDSDRPYPAATMAFEHIALHPKAYRALLDTNNQSFFLAQLNEYLVMIFKTLIEETLKGEDQILLPQDIDLMVSYLSEAFSGMARWWLHADMPYPPAEMGRRFVEIFKQGITSTVKDWMCDSENT